MKPPIILKNNKRRFLTLLLAMAATFFGGELLAQTIVYTQNTLQVSVTAHHPCEGGNNGFLSFTVNASSAAQVRIQFLLGPPDAEFNYDLPAIVNLGVGGTFVF